MGKIYDVHWQGPYSYEEFEELEHDPSLVLYSIYSTHPLYGRDVLVYIGKTLQGAKTRMSQHAWWAKNESNPVIIYAASIGEFTTWEKWETIEEYPPISDSIISYIEELLIYSHQPAYNSRSINSVREGDNIRVMNTGKYGSLLPELSSLYYIGI